MMGLEPEPIIVRGEDRGIVLELGPVMVLLAQPEEVARLINAFACLGVAHWGQPFIDLLQDTLGQPSALLSPH